MAFQNLCSNLRAARRFASLRLLWPGVHGVDGSLLAPVSLAATESWPCIAADLKPLLQKITQTRLEAGFSLEESLPCFQATDSYHKHRTKMSKLYGKVWQDLRAQGQSIILAYCWWFRNPAITSWYGSLSHYLHLFTRFYTSKRWWSPDFWTIKSILRIRSGKFVIKCFSPLPSAGE